MSRQRRYRNFLFDPQYIITILNFARLRDGKLGITVPIFEGLPEDAYIINMAFDYQLNMWAFTIESAEFEIVPPNTMIPVFPSPETKHQSVTVKETVIADQLLHALHGTVAFIGVMFGSRDGTVPEKMLTPLHVPIKLGEIFTEAEAAIKKAEQ